MDALTRQIRRRRRMTQPVRLTMQQLAVIREALLARRDELRQAIAPFGMTTTWDATTRLDDVIAEIRSARCALKRRQHPDYNPAGDSECVDEASDDDLRRWDGGAPGAR